MQELHFKDDFFKGEEIEGFFVEEKMKRAWAAELKVLIHFDDICKRHNLTYYAGFGTLLGAVRHKGFVPWDDDIDVAMPRQDYMKFLRIAKNELPKSYVVNSFHTSETHPEPVSSITNRSTVWEDKSITEEYFGCPFIVGIDVYPLDYVPRDKEIKNVFLMLYSAAYDGAQRADELIASGEMDAVLPQLEDIAKVKLDRSKPLAHQLWLLSEKIASMFTEDECDELIWLPFLVVRKYYTLMKKEWWGTPKRGDFMGISISLPENPDGILAANYGAEYMKPIVAFLHDYPFYKIQEEYLNSRGVFL